jgi:dipeptidyl aminopeptidase/acylaminoacyl peptidase
MTMARSTQRGSSSTTATVVTLRTDEVSDGPVGAAVAAHMRRLRQAQTGRVFGASEPVFSRDASRIAFTGQTREAPDVAATTRICIVNASSGSAIETLTSDGAKSWMPRWSPDGQVIAFLSDRDESGVARPFTVAVDNPSDCRLLAAPPASVEYLNWSRSGEAILLGVADLGADRAGAQGSGRLPDAPPDEAWRPRVWSSGKLEGWRRAIVVDARGAGQRFITPDGLNVWEACWLGDDRLAAVVSESPGEDAWYSAFPVVIDLSGGWTPLLPAGARQFGMVAGSPSGRQVALVEAFCSDRTVVAGDLLFLDPLGSRDVVRVETHAVDVTYLQWMDDVNLFYMGLRGLETVAGLCNAESLSVVEVWSSNESCGGYHPSAAAGPNQTFTLVLDSHERYPEVAMVRAGRAETVASLRPDGWSPVGRMEPLSWRARDELEIQGLLLTPDLPPPHPLVVHVHGGPVWAYRNRAAWSEPLGDLLLAHGYAILFPNPRGSAGRGQTYAELIRGDAAGEETHDHIAGVEALIARGIADPAKIGVMGGSHGGFITDWIVTQTDIFAAAVATAPVSNLISNHLTCNIPTLDRLIVQEEPFYKAKAYLERSAIMFAHRVRTPVLQIAGTLDDCTPPTQALEFHNALCAAGVESELAIYPLEGHGVRDERALVDYYTRLISWFVKHMPR